MRRPRGLSIRLAVGIGTCAAVHLSIFTVLLVALHDLRGADRTARDTARVAIAAGDARAAIVELAASERGVALSQAGPAYLRGWLRTAAMVRARALELSTTTDAGAPRWARALSGDVQQYAAVYLTPALVTGSSDPAALRRRIATTTQKGRTRDAAAQLQAFVLRERAIRRQQRDHTSQLTRLAWIAGGLGVVATLGCAIGLLAYLSRAILTPLRAVAEAARALAAGDLRARVSDHHGRGEVTELSQTFDQMAASLADSRAALERQNAELEDHRADLVEAARSAREGTSVLRAVLDATPDAIALLDRDGAVIVDNPPMREVRQAFGPRASAIDQHGALVPLHDDDAQADRRDEIMLLGTRRVFARYVAPVRDGGGQPIGRLVVLREITGEREAERAQEEFFALVSHELRTPLTAILGYVELLLAEDGETIADEHQRHLEVVERNAQRLLRLVGDLLFAAQVEHGSLLFEPRAVDLGELARDAVDAARPRAESAGIELSTQIEAVGPCLGDHDRLAQVLDNLISNALKFTPPGGRVTVQLGQDGASARLAVGDTGVGIPAEDLSRLFDRFYRATNATARAVPGLGLGLTIVRAIVEGHGGSVHVDSDVGRGTTFAVLLPLGTAGPAEPAVAGTDRDAPGDPRYSAGGR
jgi:signal transduction histidine kinase/HAMP domain-containing protein